MRFWAKVPLLGLIVFVALAVAAGVRPGTSRILVGLCLVLFWIGVVATMLRHRRRRLAQWELAGPDRSESGNISGNKSGKR
jgi:hypothetical protein